tara:strand:+ start:8708 stop:9109 length:402 start_codon:yes stop_codon:yes gene_type:complete
MPNVAGKKFPYTKEGMAEAEEAKKKMPKMMKGGKMQAYQEGGGVMPMKGQGNMPLDDEQAAAAIANLKKQKASKKAKPKAKGKSDVVAKKKIAAMGNMPSFDSAEKKMPMMKKGGKVRGAGKATKGVRACKMR